MTARISMQLIKILLLAGCLAQPAIAAPDIVANNTTTTNLTVLGNTNLLGTINAPNLKINLSNIGNLTVGGVLTVNGTIKAPSATIGAITATTIVGSGAGITNLNASYLASGTIPWARIGPMTGGDLTGSLPAPEVIDNSHNHSQISVTGFLLSTAAVPVYLLDLSTIALAIANATTTVPTFMYASTGTWSAEQYFSSAAFNRVCINGDCKTAWPTGGGGGGSGNVYTPGGNPGYLAMFSQGNSTVTASTYTFENENGLNISSNVLTVGDITAYGRLYAEDVIATYGVEAASGNIAGVLNTGYLLVNSTDGLNGNIVKVSSGAVLIDGTDPRLVVGPRLSSNYLLYLNADGVQLPDSYAMNIRNLNYWSSGITMDIMNGYGVNVLVNGDRTDNKGMHVWAHNGTGVEVFGGNNSNPAFYYHALINGQDVGTGPAFYASHYINTFSSDVFKAEMGIDGSAFTGRFLNFRDKYLDKFLIDATGYLWSASSATFTDVYANSFNGYVPSQYVDMSTGTPNSRNINTTAPIYGGGDLSADRTLYLGTITSALVDSSIRITTVPITGADTTGILLATAAVPGALLDLSTYTFGGGGGNAYTDVGVIGDAAYYVAADSIAASGIKISTIRTTTTAITSADVDASVLISTKAVPTDIVDLSTVSSALAGKLSNTEAVPTALVDLSTVTTELSTKLSSGPITSAMVDASVLIATSPFGGDVSGTYDATIVADDSHNHSQISVTGFTTSTATTLEIAQATTSANVALLASSPTLSGTWTFLNPVAGSITGNAGTVTNGVYTNQSYSNPSWITYIAPNKLDYSTITLAIQNSTTTSFAAFLASSPTFSSLITVPMIHFDTNTTPSGFREGRLYYDAPNKTLAAQIDADVTLQIGQENHVLVHNATASPLTNGQVVYITGASDSEPTVAPADARYSTMSYVLGVVTNASIASGAHGLVTTFGAVNDLNTSAWSEGTQLYLSSTTPGAFTSIPPSEGGQDVRIARVLISNASTGRILVNVRQMFQLTDASDVTISTPTAGQLLIYNGLEWVNGSGQAVAAGPGISFYYDGTMITVPGTQNVTGVETLSKTPWAHAEDVESNIVSNNTILAEAYVHDTPLGRTKLDAGPWEFFSWTGVDKSQGVTVILRNVMRVRTSTGTITSSDIGTSSRTFTCTGDTPFETTSIDVGGTVDSDSYVKTAKGLYRILNRISNTVVQAAVPSTYTNETSTFSVHKRLFQSVSSEINNIAGAAPLYPGLIQVSNKSVQPEFTILETDKIAVYRFVRTDANTNTTVYFAYGGTERYSYLTTPLTTLHNNLPALQGGTGSGITGEYYHLTQAKYLEVSTLSTDLAAKISRYGDTMSGQLTVSSSVVANLGATAQHTVFTASGTINDFLQYDIQNNSNGSAAQSGYSATADNGTSASNFMWLGINNSGFTDTSDWNVGAAGDTSLLSSYNDLYIANRTGDKRILFLTDGTKAANIRMVIDATGTVTMNGKLSVIGTINGLDASTIRTATTPIVSADITSLDAAKLTGAVPGAALDLSTYTFGGGGNAYTSIGVVGQIPYYVATDSIAAAGIQPSQILTSTNTTVARTNAANTFTVSSNGVYLNRFDNPDTGTSAASQIAMLVGGSANMELSQWVENHSLYPGKTILGANGTGGLALYAGHASGRINFYTKGAPTIANLKMSMEPDGAVTVTSSTTIIGAGGLSVSYGVAASTVATTSTATLAALNVTGAVEFQKPVNVSIVHISSTCAMGSGIIVCTADCQDSLVTGYSASAPYPWGFEGYQYSGVGYAPYYCKPYQNGYRCVWEVGTKTGNAFVFASCSKVY